MMNIVLHEPEIPHNTGAIGRTCLLTGSCLHLIHPLGFFLDDKYLKRPGLDYWPKIKLREYASFADFLEQNPGRRLFLAETGAARFYSQVKFSPDDFIVFGGEVRGLPKQLLEQYREQTISIPMIAGERSLNLSVAVGIILYEALRQNDFKM